MVHLADYLASRKCLTMDFENFSTPKQELPNINTWVFNFGKWKGKTIAEVDKVAPDYLQWCYENIDREPVKGLLQTYFTDKNKRSSV